MVWLLSFRQTNSHQPLDDQDNISRYLLRAYVGIILESQSDIMCDLAVHYLYSNKCVV